MRGGIKAGGDPEWDRCRIKAAPDLIRGPA